MTMDLFRNIVKRSKLHNKYLKNNNKENRKLYTKQRHYRVSLLRKTKKAYYENLDQRKVSDNRLLWKTIKPSLSKKMPCQRKYKFE